MVVACLAVVLALTGSAVAAGLITGRDIQNGSITKADLSRGTINSLKGRRGPAGRNGQDGFVGAQGPQGSTGPEGPRGPAGPAGPQGPKGTTGDTGARGPEGRQGPTGLQGATGNDGPQGLPGQSLVANFVTSGGPIDVGTALALTDPAPTDTQGVDLSNGGTVLSAFTQYKVDVTVTFSDPNATDAALEYGVGRLFLGTTPLDGVNATPAGGNSDADTTIVTGDVPDDRTNTASVTQSFIVTPGDDGVNGGELLTVRGAVRTGEPDGASATAHVIITRIG